MRTKIARALVVLMRLEYLLQFIELNGEEVCVNIHLEWNRTFDSLLVQFSFRKKLYDSSKTAA
jgi:hypothetical protein